MTDEIKAAIERVQKANADVTAATDRVNAANEVHQNAKVAWDAASDELAEAEENLMNTIMLSTLPAGSPS